MTRMNNTNMLFHKPPDLSQLCSLHTVIYGPNSASYLIRTLESLSGNIYYFHCFDAMSKIVFSSTFVRIIGCYIVIDKNNLYKTKRDEEYSIRIKIIYKCINIILKKFKQSFYKIYQIPKISK